MCVCVCVCVCGGGTALSLGGGGGVMMDECAFIGKTALSFSFLLGCFQRKCRGIVIALAVAVP